MPAVKKSALFRLRFMHGRCAALLPAVALAWAILPIGAVLPAAAAKTRAVSAAVPAIAQAQSFSGAYLAGTYAADTGSALAEPYLRRALALRPDSVPARRALLLSLIDSGDYNAAVKLAAGLAGMSDDNDTAPMARLILAADAIKQKRYKKVEQIISRPGQSKDESLLWVFLTAWADYGRGRKSLAVRNLGNARFSEWYSFLSAYNIALIEDLSGNRAGAANAFQAAFSYNQLAQMAPEAYAHMVWAYASFLQRTEGSEVALAALDRAGQIINGENIVFDALRDNLRHGRAVPRLVATPAQGAAEFAYDIGSAFQRAGEDLYADIYLQTAVFLRPDSDAALFRLGILAIRAGQLHKAQLFFARLPRNSLYYNDMQLLTALSINQRLADKSDATKRQNKQAAQELEAMIAKAGPDKTALENVLANVYLQTEDYPAAVKTLDRLIGKIKLPQKRDWSIYFQRGIAYERLNNWPKAEADFRLTLRLNPQSADALNYYGYSLVDKGLNLERGLEMTRRAALLEPKNGAIIDSLGWAYYKMGRYDEALPLLEKAVRLEPGESSINDHLGDVYWRMGDKLPAVFQWNHALAYNPDPKDVPAIRAKLQHGLAPVKATLTAPVAPPAPEAQPDDDNLPPPADDNGGDGEDNDDYLP